MREIRYETLLHVLSEMLGENIIRVDFEAQSLHGGTLGEVHLITGIAVTADDKKKSFCVVRKIQKRWERPGDTNSWRREYDLYISSFDAVFSDSLRRPTCYLGEKREDEIELWTEYIDGISGNSLSVEILELAAAELGRFQGRLHRELSTVRVSDLSRKAKLEFAYCEESLAEKHHSDPMISEILQEITCLGDTGFMEREFEQWHTQMFTHEFLISEECRLPESLKQMITTHKVRLFDGKSFEYSFLRSEACDTIPEHLREMLIDVDDRKGTLFDDIKSTPIVLCHKDFWIENLFEINGEFRLIDWDCAGWGYMGEDIASLIADETEPTHMETYFHRLVPAYFRGIGEYMDISFTRNSHVREMILIKFGYRILQEYIFSESSDVKGRQIKALQAIFNMGQGNP